MSGKPRFGDFLKERKLVKEELIKYYVHWEERFVRYLQADG